MRYKWICGILALCVCALMLLPSAFATVWPPIWINQATLSTPDLLASQDPENSGFGMTQVTVWEEFNGINWDIYMRYSFLDGLGGSWIFPALPATHPATTINHERNPAVSVTRDHGPGIGQEIHVVYERWNPGGFWEICHTYTNNLGVPFGTVWIGPVVLSRAGFSSTNPACVYTEDQAFPVAGGVIGFLFQVVWEEAFVVGGTRIMYRAYAYDPTWPIAVRGYVPGIPGAPFAIRTPPGGSICELPEIASVDERVSPLAYDYYFSIVWQETTLVGNWNIWYVDGTTTTSAPPPPPPPISLTVGSLGIVNVVVPGTDHTDPDIAASQDYQPIGLAQSYFFHVDYVKQGPNPGGGTVFSVDQCYSYGGAPTPGSAVFTIPAPVHVGITLVVPPPVLIDNPTIATKLTSVAGALPITFQTWFAWEDNIVVATTDIWYRVGFYTTGPPPAFGYAGILGMRVPYLPLAAPDIEQNPEFWNREDALRLNPPVTHLVFDRANGPAIEVEYIDP